MNVEYQGAAAPAAAPTYGSIEPGTVFVLAQDNSRDGQNRPRLRTDAGHVRLADGKSFDEGSLSDDREVTILDARFVID